ncbi:hypothetical protein GCM10009827_025200 [Dactylosporangium maewongense]|uniref:Endo-1,4-beta-xylanase n=1 Tax=Dactylosporangium maewongense TaxID=634393 RepID=A0ABN2A3L0_9ACTN
MLRRALAALATAALLGAVLVAPQPATAAEYVSNGTFSGGTASWLQSRGGKYYNSQSTM